MQHLPRTRREMVKIAGWSLPKSLPNLLLFLIIFFSSTQLGLHFWPHSALIYGLRVDYLSPVLYFLDCLILVYLWVTRSQVKFTRLVPLLPILSANLLFSLNPLASLSWSLHLLLYLTFISTLSGKTSRLLLPLTLSLLFQAGLALAQFSLSRSVQGIFYYFGERIVSVGSPAIALATLRDQVVLRAYGTFSHPNVLAGWLLVSFLIILKLTKLRAQTPLAFFMLIPTTLGLFLTQSRASLLAFFSLVLPFYFLRSTKLRTLYFSLILCLVLILRSPLTSLATRSDLSVLDRVDLQQISLKTIHSQPIFGTGAQSALILYPRLSPTTRLLQPDHNSATLIFSWFGAFGILALLYLFRPHLNLPLFIALIPLFPLLLLDHYFLTSPQGLFALILYLRLSLR